MASAVSELKAAAEATAEEQRQRHAAERAEDRQRHAAERAEDRRLLERLTVLLDQVARPAPAIVV